MIIRRSTWRLAALLGMGALGACSVFSSSRQPGPAGAAVSVTPVAAGACAPGIWFCEDFENGLGRWNLLPGGAGATIGNADGKAEIIQDGSSKVLRYDAGKSRGVVAILRDEAFSAVAARKTADYYVEARIKPINNQTSNKFVCLLGRVQDVNNWYGGCLNVQNGASSKLEFHKANGGKWLRARQFSARTIVNDQWYKLRMEMKGSELNFYIDDDFAGSFSDPSITSAGRIGMWLDNRSFAIDDIQVGSADVKPVLLSLDQDEEWTSEAGGKPLEVNVSATKSDGSPDVYSVVSSNPAVVSVKQDGKRSVLEALGAGSATITFTSGANPAKTKQIKASIEPAFVMASNTYGSLAALTQPAAGSKAAYADGELSLRFDTAPVFSGIGSVRIFRASDDTLVDVIRPKNETNIYGPSADGFYRGVNMPLMRFEGTTLVVRPHQGKLAWGEHYYVAVSAPLLKDARLAGKPFEGLGKAAGWTFSTRPAPAKTLTTLTVDDDGVKADFRSVQGALEHVMKSLSKETPVTIKVKNGTYEELLFLRGKNNVTLQGESRDGTLIQFANYEALNSGLAAGIKEQAVTNRGGRAVFAVADSDLLTIENLTLKNSHLKKVGVNGQAETIYFAADKERLIAKNANFISRQDTLQLNGYSWFYNTLVAGDVDFIWGSSKAALFENSEIRTVVDSTDASKGGYLVQARVESADDKGYVFLNSRLTREDGVPDGATVLARSAGSPRYFDNVIYVNSRMDKHISPEGWWMSPIPNPAKADGKAGWREFGSRTLSGEPLALSERVKAAHSLSEAEAAPYATREAVFSAIGWKPAP
ncbi:pectinesterase family protein [Uliginosibacterium paludis]|uniref:Pectinesterase family protein n=1 Tax=Uliginosibacterium paludis TaxID=1615952 RepID=A0ABV2CUH9_9RHOO